MCEYCNVQSIGDGELSNDCVLINRITDGSQTIDLYIWRYIFEKSDEIRENSLLIDCGVKLSDGIRSVKIKETQIQYCPFCGEKL